MEDDADVRPLEPDDAEGMLALLELLGYPASSAQVGSRIARIAEDDHYATWGAFVTARLAAYAAARLLWTLEYDEPVVQLIGLATLPTYGGRGLGSLLLRHVEAWGREQGAGLVVLTSASHRARAHAFYRSRGYRVTGLRFVKDLTA